MEGREESESGEEDAEVEVADPEAAEAAAIQAAMGDGAQIVSTREARVASSADAGGSLLVTVLAECRPVSGGSDAHPSVPGTDGCPADC